MDKGFSRSGRRSKYGARTSTSEDTKPSLSELVNGGSGKDKMGESLETSTLKSNADIKVSSDPESVKIKEEDCSDESKVNNSESTEFHGFDDPSAPSGASVVNKLVGKYQADLEDQDLPATECNDEGVEESGHKVLGQDIYTDSEDESSKPAKGVKEGKLAPKKRPLEQLAVAEKLNEDEKTGAPPPAKRQRKKSAKAREAAGDKMDNMKLLSDVSSEVTSSEDVPRKTKVKEESHSEVTSSGTTPASQLKKAADAGSVGRGSRHSVKSISDPIYLKPLEKGWKRELVYRKTDPKGGDGTKRTGDIYYYTPAGKKVRSRVEILEHLKGTEFTVDHFSFLKEPIGLDDPSKEIIREASVRKSLAESSPAVKREKSPKMPKQKALKGAGAADSPSVTDETSNASAGGSNGTTTSPSNTPSVAKTVTPRVVLKSTKSPKPGPKVKVTPSRKANAESSPPKAKGVRSKKENSQSIEGALESGSLPPNWDQKDQNVAERSTSNSTPGAWKAKNSSLKATSSSHVPPEQCSIRCVGTQGVIGVIPTLQCRICLCLHHPECVGLDPSSETIHSYICQNCTTGSDDTSSNMGSTCAGGALVPLQPNVHRALSGSHKIASVRSSKALGQRLVRPPGGSSDSQPVLHPPAPPGAGPAPSESPAPPQTVATIGGQKFIVVPKHNVLAVSPGGVTHAVHQSNNARMGTQPGVYFVPGSRGLSSDLLASKRAKMGDSTDATVESTTAGGQGKTPAKRDMDNFISDLSSGYGALLHVMGYLKVQELLRASRVCRLWRDLSLHPNLWHTVRMKNSQVSDWEGFAAALSARGTRVLDLRKMLAPGRPEDIELMWSEFCRVIGRVDCLNRVELSRCPASVVEQLATSCPQLKVINAIAIKSEEVDLESIRQVPLLEELRLKSNNGMNITRTLDPLLFCRLKHLSLTSVKNLGSCNVEVISKLQNLESLELGDCIKLSNTFGPDHLAKLTKLERLRLEKGHVPGCPVIPIIESVAKLPALRQLEIINFDVKPGLDKALAMCKQVRRLLIIPTYITTSAATNHIVLCSIPLLADSLEHLVWGLTQELTRVTDLFIDQCEARKGVQGSSKLNSYPGECIPIIKPILGEEKDKETKSTENGEEKDDDKDGGDKMDVDEESKPKVDGKDDEEKPQKEKDEAASTDSEEVETLAQGFRALSAMDQTEEGPSGTPPVSILPIPKLHKLLNQLLPNTRVKILKVPFLSTWRQTFPELSSFQ